MTRCNPEAIHQEFEMQFTAIKTQMRLGGDGDAESIIIIVKPPKFDRSTSYTLLHHQFEAMTDHIWAVRGKATNPFAVMDG
jgi:hypothetical protein